MVKLSVSLLLLPAEGDIPQHFSHHGHGQILNNTEAPLANVFVVLRSHMGKY